MLKTTIFPGRYIQGPGSLQSLGKEAARLGDYALILLSPFVKKNLITHIQSQLEGSVTAYIEEFQGQCSDEEIQRLLSVAPDQVNMVIGIGGGKTLDTAKAVAYHRKTPVMIVPTIASTDAPCSALSIIYTSDGVFKRVLFFTKNPDTVLVDTSIIAKAPVRFLVSGMGDAIATFFEAESCRIAYRPNMTGNYGSITAFSLSRLCYDTLLQYGLAAKQAGQAGVTTPAFERIVEANTLLSGLGFESGGLASAHAIHNGLTVLKDTHQYFHGEKVAIGVLASLVLTDQPPSVIQEIYDFYHKVGLPTTLADIGLVNYTDDDLLKVAKATCAVGESIHNEPFPITPSDVLAALKSIDYKKNI